MWPQLRPCPARPVRSRSFFSPARGQDVGFEGPARRAIFFSSRLSQISSHNPARPDRTGPDPTRRRSAVGSCPPIARVNVSVAKSHRTALCPCRVRSVIGSVHLSARDRSYTFSGAQTPFLCVLILILSARSSPFTHYAREWTELRFF